MSSLNRITLWIFFFQIDIMHKKLYLMLFIFAAIAIYFGVNLEKSNTPEEASYIVIAYIINYVIIEVVLECQKYFRRNEGTDWWSYIKKNNWHLENMFSGDRVFIVYDSDSKWTTFDHVIVNQTETLILLRSTANVPQQKSQVRRWKRVT